jgi:hypothetical protein
MTVMRRSLFVALCISILAIWAVSVQTLAQSDGSEWATPVNLSDSGAASSPVIVVGPDGTLRILWWDEFDGLVGSDGFVSALRAPGATSPVSETLEAWSAPTKLPIPLPDETTPQIVGDANGQVHAFWLGKPNEKTGAHALVYSHLAPGETAWMTPVNLAESAASWDATTDLTGTLHVAYVQPVQVKDAPVGLYYRQSGNGGAEWSAPTPIFLSRYLRLLSDAQKDLRLTAYGPDRVYAAWNDPIEGQVSASRTADSGVTWSEPLPYVGSTDQPWEEQVMALPGGSAPLLWDWTSEGLGLVAVSASDEALTLAVWDGDRWSETKHLPFRFQDPERGEPLFLSSVRVALAPPIPDQEDAGEKLIVVGIDQREDLWISGIQMEEMERLLAASGMDFEPRGSGEGQAGGLPAPQNLSQSGAASNPVVVSGLDNTLRAFWWDRFDGLTLVDGTVTVSTVLSGTQEIETLRDSWSEPRPLPLPATTTPQILSDARGRVHAFWFQESTAGQRASAPRLENAGGQSLMYSQMATDAASWLPPAILAESATSFDVTTDAAGVLHLAYVQTVDTQNSASGIYYRRTEEDGVGWSRPVGLDLSRYIRLLTQDTAHVSLAAEEAGGVYATWDESRHGELLLAYSPDGGVTWEGPKPIVDFEGQARQGKLVAVPGSETLLFWQEAGSGSTCGLYQAVAANVASGTTVSGQRILGELVQCPENAQFLPLAEGQILMVAGTGSDALVLAAWNGERWSEPRRLTYNFVDPEMANWVYINELRATLVGLPESSSEGPSDKALIVVGSDLEGDIWATDRQTGMLELLFAPLPPWSAPLDFAQREEVPGVPAIVSDLEGRLHVLWTDAPARGESASALMYVRRDEASSSNGSEVRWTNPTTVFSSSDGEVAQPALIVTDDRLHAVWRGDQNAEIFYSQAFVSDAYLAKGGWKAVQPLSAPGTLASWPDIAADSGGTLHVVYAVPINEGRGIYYMRSEDGENWSEARQIFDAAGAGWAMSDYPRLAVDTGGAVHVVWLHTAPLGRGMTVGIFYTRSVDGGETWSEPLEIVEGDNAWTQITTNSAGTVQILWNEATGQQGWWHLWSTDGGANWTQPEPVPGFGNVPGPIGMLADGSGTVHLVGLGQDNDEEPALIYITWDGQRWGERESFQLDLMEDEPLPGVAVAALPALGQLDAVFRGAGTEGEVQRTNLWHSVREIPVVVTAPVPTITPRPTQTPVPTSTPPPLPTPTRTFSQAPPPSAGGSLADLLPLLLPGGLAALILAGAFSIRLVRARRP